MTTESNFSKPRHDYTIILLLLTDNDGHNRYENSGQSPG